MYMVGRPLCLKFTTGDFLVSIGDINKRFILDFFMMLKGAFAENQL